MISSQYIALMHGEIDGINTAADSQHLREYLAEHPQAADHFKELRQALDAFEGAPILEPPADLRQRILDAVDMPEEPVQETQSARSGARVGGWRAFWRDLRRRPGYRLAFATGFAVSLLAVAAAWQMTAHVDSIEPGNIRGSILREFESGDGVHGEPISIDLAGATATVQAHRAGNRTLVRLVLSGDGPLHIHILTAGRLACESFHATPPAIGEIAVSARRVTLVLQGAGEHDLVLHHLESGSPELTLQVLDGQTVVFEQPLIR